MPLCDLGQTVWVCQPLGGSLQYFTFSTNAAWPPASTLRETTLHSVEACTTWMAGCAVAAALLTGVAWPLTRGLYAAYSTPISCSY